MLHCFDGSNNVIGEVAQSNYMGFVEFLRCNGPFLGGYQRCMRALTGDQWCRDPLSSAQGSQLSRRVGLGGGG